MEAVRRHAPELLPHVSETATPMHYTAEIARERHPDTVAVFIGPCVAKRQEGLHDEMVDYVLTFEEVGALFNARGIVVEECEEHELEHPSNEARGYAIAGGVSAAVEKLVGDRFEVRPVAINGLSPQGLKKLQSFVKGGCPGNLLGISRIVIGMKAEDVIERFRGTRCGFKSTSCPDQLSYALEEALAAAAK